MEAQKMRVDFETEIVDLLGDLTEVQDELLEVLKAKRQRMARCDAAGMAELEPREEDLVRRLAECQHRRQALLDQASTEGYPAKDLCQLASMMPKESRGNLETKVGEVSARVRLLQHHSLTNWVLAQRTLLHLAQMLEIIATGGRLQPTYDKGASALARGSLLDQEG